MGTSSAIDGRDVTDDGVPSHPPERSEPRRWAILPQRSTTSLAIEVEHAIDVGTITGVIVTASARVEPGADLIETSAYCRARGVPFVLAIDVREVPVASERALAGAACRHDPRFADTFASALSSLVSAVRPTAILGREWAPRSGADACAECVGVFSDQTGQDASTLVDRDGSAYLAWALWTVARTTALWEALDDAFRAVDGGTTRWSGLIPGDLSSQLDSGIDLRTIAASTPTVFVDAMGFTGARRVQRTRVALARIVDAVDAPVVAVQPGAFQNASFARAIESRELATSAVLASMQGAEIAATERAWDRVIDELGDDIVDLVIGGRRFAEVAIAWSNANHLAYGRQWSGLLVDMPYDGIATALDALHVPYRSVAIEALEDELAGIKLLILPDLAVLSARAESAVRAYVEGGGALLATGITGMLDDRGQSRSHGRLDDVLGVRRTAVDRLDAITAHVDHGFAAGPPLGRLYGPATEHSYVRLLPELARTPAGPHVEREPLVDDHRHPILDGFESTDLLAFGGRIPSMQVQSDRAVLATLVPAFPSMPIEEVYPQPERTDIPAVIVGEFRSGRVVHLPADFDRRFGADPLPDHLALLGNIVDWLVGTPGSAVACEDGSVISSWRIAPDGLRLQLLNTTGLGSGGQRRSIPPARGISAVASGVTVSVDHLETYTARSIDSRGTEKIK